MTTCLCHRYSAWMLMKYWIWWYKWFGTSNWISPLTIASVLIHFQKTFPYFFNTKLKTSVPSFGSFLENFTHGTQCKNICRTVISGKVKNLNKQMVELRISILFQYFMHILAKFNTFSRSWKPISQCNTFLILSIPCGNPE